MAFTASDVKRLREQTGCGMMDCKKALTEADGDFDKAVDYLREKGLAAATKKAGRIAAEGMVSVVIRGNAGVIIEVNSETDFVAKNDQFRNFVELCANVVIDQRPADVEALLACKVGEKTVEEELREQILTIGENIKIRRFEYQEGNLVSYIHGGGTVAVLVNFDTDAATAAKPEFETYGKDVAMQIAAMNPLYLNKESVPAADIEKEKEIQIAQMQNDPKMANKPTNVLEKIVMGKMGKFYKENCLVEQTFVKDNELTIATYTNKVAKELGGEISVKGFVRYEKGEGLEKRNDDFAAEVASMVK